MSLRKIEKVKSKKKKRCVKIYQAYNYTPKAATLVLYILELLNSHIYKLYVSVYYSLFFEYMLFILPMSNKHFQKLIRFMTTKS